MARRRRLTTPDGAAVSEQLPLMIEPQPQVLDPRITPTGPVHRAPPEYEVLPEPQEEARPVEPAVAPELEPYEPIVVDAFPVDRTPPPEEPAPTQPPVPFPVPRLPI